MALLTAEDVLNKAFSKTKYREGFDQDEVDDFLDEVANTIAQLTAERDELAARAAGGGMPAAAPAPEAPPATAAGGVPGTSGLLAAATEPGGANPTGMLAMAQKLHDEYVQAGEAERDRIIDEAHSTADQIRERADAEAKARMEELGGERADLEARIDDLRRFERDYRARLKAYLENLLGDLDHSGAAAGGLSSAAFAGAGFPDLPAADAPAQEAPAQDAFAQEAPAQEAFAQEEPAQEAPVAQAPTIQAPVDTAPANEPAVPSEAYGEDSVGQVDEPVGEGYQAAPVSFEEALTGVQPTPQEPVPAYDAQQSWESQLRPPSEPAYDAPQANPWAPVTPASEGEQQGDQPVQGVPGVDQPHDDEVPYTPPSSRMFNDLYSQQHPESEN